MKFVLGPIPRDPDFDPESAEGGWTRHESGDLAILFLVAFLVGGVLAIAQWVTWVLGHVDEVLDPGFSIGRLSLAALSMLFLVPLHELVHGMFLPGGAFSSRRTYGCWPQRFIFFAQHHGEVPRWQLGVSLLAPFVLLSVFPFLVVLWIEPSPGIWYVTLIAFHTNSCGGDFVSFWDLVRKTPRGARVRSHGLTPYFRSPEGPRRGG